MKKKFLAFVVVALLSLSSVSTFAASSPTAAPQYKIQVSDQTVPAAGSTIKVPGGSVQTSAGAIEVGKEVTLKATADSGKSFSKWNITGTYTIVSGSETSDTIVILPTSDIKVNADFVDSAQPTTVAAETASVAETTVTNDTDVDDDEDIDDEDEDEDIDDEEDEDVNGSDEDKGSTDSSTTSPKTGAPVAAVVVTLLAAGGVAISSKKRI